MTLIAVYDKNGCVGRCDAKCYNAAHAKCDCICGGRNHQAGEKRAVENTREYVDDMVQDWNAKHPGQEFTFPVSDDVKQLSLF